MTVVAGTTRGAISAEPMSFGGILSTEIVSVTASGLAGFSFRSFGAVFVPSIPKSPSLTNVVGLSSHRATFIVNQGKRQKFLQPPAVAVPSIHTSPIAVISDLACPGGLAWLPNGTLLFTQRDRSLLNIGDAAIHIPNCVATGGDGGAMGIAVDPNYAANSFIYIAQTTQVNGLTTNGNALVRYRLNNRVLTDGTVLTTWDSNTNNNGGVVKFGPDGYLYVGTGTASNNNASQSLISHSGKILRMKTDGTPASDNPFGSLIWAYGFQNVVGLTWEGVHLWATDQGISGYDEINLIRPKRDYGFPYAVGQNSATNLYQVQSTPAALTSGPDDIWKPCGIAFAAGNLYFGCLGKTIASGHGAQALGKSKVIGSDLVGKTNLFVGQYGRIRDVALGPDGDLYFSTSNNDGIGVGIADSIYRVTPAAL